MMKNDLFDLTDNVVVITGATGHLGKAISEGLLQAGAKLFITSKNYEKSLRTAELLRNNYKDNVEALELDISSSKSVSSSLRHIYQTEGKIDVLVNNANFNTSYTIENMSESNWLAGLDGTINGVFRTTKAILPYMKMQNGGSIINIASMYGIVSPNPALYDGTGFFNPANYGSGKAAILQFSRYTACFFAKYGIRVNSISPGAFPNEKVQEDQIFIERLCEKVPLGRIGQPEELKGAVVFLASKAASYVTGINLVVDGGWTAW
jgi:NAD(P)-dependent dehydrogenase (short-subunit alcohol dehydrogenase family)